MATSELKPSSLPSSSEEENLDDEGFETEECVITDDSDEDPTFEEMRSRFSGISLKKTRPRLFKKRDDGSEEMEAVEVEVPQLDDKDRNCFENVEKMIKNGQVNKLKVDQCKVYLRKYGLRLTGNKDILIGRIREHLEVIDGAGEKKYPISSFVINCQGDACKGDVLMFEQKVYEMYSVASRSASGPPCGTRINTGRVVKESYGAAKQQHTFTVEVLWSKGEKPLPPLHPLLIKGRNLYRLKTVRQKWADEEERRKVLQEKHMRGSTARYSREIRVQGKEMRKLNRGKSLRVNERKGNKKFMPEQLAQLQLSHKQVEYEYHHPNHMTYTGNQNIQSQNHPIFTEKKSIAEEPQGCFFQAIDKQLSNSLQAIKPIVAEKHDNSIPQVPHNYDAAQVMKKRDSTSIAGVPVQNLNGFSDRQPLRDLNPPNTPRNGYLHGQPPRNVDIPQSPTNGFHVTQPAMNDSCPPHSARNWNFHGQPQRSLQSPQRSSNTCHSSRNGFHVRQPIQNYCSPPHSPRHGYVHRQPTRSFQAPQSPGNGFFNKPLPRDQQTSHSVSILGPPPSPQRYPAQQPICRYYKERRCYFMENCKFLHE